MRTHNLNDKLFFIILVLSSTGIFRFLAPPLDVLTPRVKINVSDITAVLFLANIWYLTIRAEYIAPLLRAGLGRWGLVMVIWPVATVIYAPAFDLREFGLVLYLWSLLSASAVYTLANGLRSYYHLMLVCLVVTAIGFVLSMISPHYFEAVAQLTEGRIKFQGRSFGFFMQPNRAACALCFLFISWFAMCPFKNTPREAIAVLLFLALMLLTGSRTGAVVAGLTVALIIMHSWQHSRTKGGSLQKVAAIALCLIVGQVGLSYYSTVNNSMEARTDADLVTRMATLLSFKLTSAESVVEDKSVQERVDAQAVYWELIRERPFLGHGLGTEAHYMMNGPLFLTAHSDAITSAMQYGVLYPLVFGWLVLQFYRKSQSRSAEAAFETNSILQLAFVTLLIFTINGGLLQTRTFYVVWGMFFAAVGCPRLAFACRMPVPKTNIHTVRSPHSSKRLRGRVAVAKQRHLGALEVRDNA